jgi:hypothetical protein
LLALKSQGTYSTVTILPVTLYREPVAANRKPPMTLIIFRKPHVILKIVPKAAMTCTQFTNHREKEGWDRNSDAAFGKFLDILNVFIEANRNFLIIFFFNKIP